MLFKVFVLATVLLSFFGGREVLIGFLCNCAGCPMRFIDHAGLELRDAPKATLNI